MLLPSANGQKSAIPWGNLINHRELSCRLTSGIVQTVVVSKVNISIVRGPSSPEYAARWHTTARTINAIETCVDICGATINVSNGLVVGCANRLGADDDAATVDVLEGNVSGYRIGGLSQLNK